MSSPIFLSDQRSLEDLFSRMLSPDRETCGSFKSLKVEVAFVDRLLIVFKPQGLNKDGTHRDPIILTQIRVTDFRASAEHGCEVEVEDLSTNEVMTLGYIPKRLFYYDIYAGVAPRQKLNWDATLIHGTVRRSLSFMLLFKERSSVENFSHGVTGIVTPAKFRELFPSVPLTLNQIS